MFKSNLFDFLLKVGHSITIEADRLAGQFFHLYRCGGLVYKESPGREDDRESCDCHAGQMFLGFTVNWLLFVMYQFSPFSSVPSMTNLRTDEYEYH